MAPIDPGPPSRDRQRMTEPRTPRRTATALALVAAVLVACTDQSAPDPEAVADGQDWKFAEEVPDAYREASLNIADGGLYSITPDGTNDAPLTAAEARKRLAGQRHLILVHGTLYDPVETGFANPHLTIYQVARQQVSGRVALAGIGWRSGGHGIGGYLDAWKDGRGGPYGLASENAIEAARLLAEALPPPPASYDFICHSIGCDIVRRVLQSDAVRPGHVLMLSPDTDYAEMARWAERTGTPVLQVTASSDGVLGFGQYAGRNKAFAPPREQGPNRSLLVDVAHYVPDRSRWSLNYWNPRRYLDHMAPLEIAALWKSYLAFLEE
jgi:hypothetical protein